MFYHTVIVRLTTFILAFMLAILPAGAAGPVEPVGVQGQVGVVEPVGPQSSYSPSGTTASEVVETASPTPSTSVPQSTATQTNEQTGPNSENTNSQSNTATTTVTETKSVEIENDVAVGVATGENEVTTNTKVGDVSSGDIEGSVTVVNVANSQFAEGSSVGTQTVDGSRTSALRLDPTLERTQLGSSNNQTGPNSSNQNSSDTANTLIVVTEHTATADNEIEIVADTGNNVITNNGVVGNVTTGDIDLAVNLINLLNVLMPNTVLSIDVWSVLQGLNGDIIIPTQENSTTGPNSENTNTATSQQTTDITVNRTANSSNTLDVEATTGNNTVANNTTTGDVTTGEVNVDGAITTIANVVQPVLYLINVFGNWVGQVAGLEGQPVIVNQFNQETGPNSTNQNTADTTTNTSITQTNTATANNNVRVVANTGGNTVSNNTQVGDIATGAINVAANIVNFLNTTGNVGQFALRIVNIFGDWTGNATPEVPTPAVANTPVTEPEGESGVESPVVTHKDTGTETKPSDNNSMGGALFETLASVIPDMTHSVSSNVAPDLPSLPTKVLPAAMERTIPMLLATATDTSSDTPAVVKPRKRVAAKPKQKTPEVKESNATTGGRYQGLYAGVPVLIILWALGEYLVNRKRSV